MFLQFMLTLCLAWAVIAFANSRNIAIEPHLDKGHWIPDYLGATTLGGSMAIAGLWLLIKIQSAIAVANVLLLLVIVANLVMAIWLTQAWLSSAPTKKRRGEPEERFYFVRNSFAAFAFWAATLYWISAALLPGSFTPIDAYTIRYTGQDLIDMIADFIIGMIVLGFIVTAVYWSLSDW